MIEILSGKTTTRQSLPNIDGYAGKIKVMKG